MRIKRSKNYANFFDKEIGFMRHKDSQGNFKKEFNEFDWASIIPRAFRGKTVLPYGTIYTD